MIEHDGDVGKLLKALDDLGIANNTIVVYTTDNGPNQFSWPDAATTPFRSEKDTNWEGAFRVPAMVRWPGKIKPGEVSNEMFSGLDWFPTLLAAAGDTDDQGPAAQGHASIGGKTFKVHLDGYNQLPYLTGQQPKSARNEFAYFNDDGVLVAFRLRQLEGRVLRDEEAGRLRGLVRAVHLPAHSEALQPAHGSLRAGRHRLRPVRRLAGQERLSDGLDDVPRRRSSSKPSSSIRRARSRRASRSIRSRGTSSAGSRRRRANNCFDRLGSPPHRRCLISGGDHAAARPEAIVDSDPRHILDQRMLEFV